MFDRKLGAWSWNTQRLSACTGMSFTSISYGTTDACCYVRYREKKCTFWFAISLPHDGMHVLRGRGYPPGSNAVESMWCHDVRHVLAAVLQKLEMAGDFVDHGLWSRTDSEYGSTATGNLCATSVVDDLSADPQADSLSLKDQQVLLALDLHGDLCLTVAFPALENWRVLA